MLISETVVCNTHTTIIQLWISQKQEHRLRFNTLSRNGCQFYVCVRFDTTTSIIFSCKCTLKLVWFSSKILFQVCGKAEKRKILLCYHPRDNRNVEKFLVSLHSINADVLRMHKELEIDKDHRDLNQAIVLMCLSKEYAASPQFEEGDVSARYCW